MSEMPTPIWQTIIVAALSGGIASAVLQHFIEWGRSYRKERKTAKAVVDAHLDPLLKAADAIVGKTISLAQRDFIPLTSQKGKSVGNVPNTELVGLAYLYANFWGCVEILQKESLGLSLSTDARGRKLSRFITCLGSQRIRLVNRTHEKAIGEITTDRLADGGLRTIGVVEFGERFSGSLNVESWFLPLTDLLSRTQDKAVRQKLLIYGVVLHALVDTLDPKHHSSHKRSSYPNKLSKESKRRIEHLVFGEYLKSTGAIDCYTRK